MKGKHRPCGLPIGVSIIWGLPTWKYPPCILADQHRGPCMDAKGFEETMFVVVKGTQ